MWILIVCSGNVRDFDFQKHQAFIFDQVEAIKQGHPGFSIEIHFIQGRGFCGYLRHLNKIKKIVQSLSIHLIHAHGGHTGLLCCLQRLVPVVVTFHGSDINRFSNRLIAVVTACFSAATMFVSQKLKEKAIIHPKHSYVIPCGVDLDLFFPMNRSEAKQALNIPERSKYILFGSSFTNPVKNYGLVRKVMEKFPEIQVKELTNRTRAEVNLLMNGAELLVLTSLSEGSPQVIKEAMACNLPVVSVDVGDVREILADTVGTFICSYDPEDVAEKIRLALAFGQRTNGREKIGHLDNRVIVEKIINVYRTVVN